MSNFTDFFPAAGGGGGGIPKYQEFTSSGTFTPTQALIDAGGRVAYMIVGGGERGIGYSDEASGGAGGQVKVGYMTLTSTNSCAVTIGAGGTSNGANGGASSVAFNSAGGTAITANGGQEHHVTNNGSNYGANHRSDYSFATASAAHPGFFGGYGAGGSSTNFNAGQGGGGAETPAANTGQGSCFGINAAAGFVRITWFE
jgi:hypothetical protein